MVTAEYRDIVDLADGVPVAFAVPEAGYVNGFRMRATAGDSLVWTVGAGCNIDMYAADGSRITWKTDEESDGKITFGMRAASDVTYALVHSASVALKMMDISCAVASSTAVSGCVSDGCSLHASRGMLVVDTPEGGVLSVTSLSGVVVFHGKLSAGHNVITLPSGVYVVAWNGVSAGKTVVP